MNPIQENHDDVRIDISDSDPIIESAVETIKVSRAIPFQMKCVRDIRSVVFSSLYSGRVSTIYFYKSGISLGRVSCIGVR
jgi:hypothetical protein